MARGAEKLRAQAKTAAKKQAEAKKAAPPAPNKKEVICPICKIVMSHPKMVPEHFSAKHPGQPLPAAST
eukprot:GDKH01000264.1.p2 GENE.GDKH01000264.1~~GDKH01000264.1.p2  ORF type:complete len:69 (+),score=14.58 GDKH01000264.1:120-326(+)